MKILRGDVRHVQMFRTSMSMNDEHPAMKAAAAVSNHLAGGKPFHIAEVAALIDKAYKSALGSVGGKASGSRKARTPEQARKAAAARWAKVRSAKK